MDPTQLFLDPQAPFTSDGKPLSAAAWKYLHDLQQSLTTIDVSTQVTGVLSYLNGGTSQANLQFTTTGPTNVTLPTIGTLHWSQAQRASTGAIGAGASALVTLTWPVTFGDTSYTPVVCVFDSKAASASLTIVHIETISATAIAVRVLNSSAGALTGTVQAIALHD